MCWLPRAKSPRRYSTPEMRARKLSSSVAGVLLGTLPDKSGCRSPSRRSANPAMQEEVRGMRIAQIAPLEESVPPKLYGGTERVVSWLTEELVALGHDVTLFASGDSRTSAQLVPVWPRALRLSRPRPDTGPPCAALLEAMASRARAFEIVHSHTDWLHLPILRRAGVPFLTTLHGRLDFAHLSQMATSFGDSPFVSISDA